MGGHAASAQEYFSFEAFQHVLAQLVSLQRVPDNLPTPRYTILRKYKDFEVRRSVHHPRCALLQEAKVCCPACWAPLDLPSVPHHKPHAGKCQMAEPGCQ